jgi:hypothetical protein
MPQVKIGIKIRPADRNGFAEGGHAFFYKNMLKPLPPVC